MTDDMSMSSNSTMVTNIIGTNLTVTVVKKGPTNIPSKSVEIQISTW